MYDTEKNLFIKHGVKKSKHLFKKGEMWGVDAYAFDYIMKPGCKIVVEEVEERKRYETTWEVVKKIGVYRHFKKYGTQVFLPLSEWKVSQL